MMEAFLKSFGDISLENVFQIGKSYYRRSSLLKKEVDSLDEYPMSAGLFLGEEQKSGFVPSPNLLNLINKQSSKHIILNEKSAWLFVCGRDVFLEGVVQDCFEKGVVLVLNEQKEVLGIAMKKGKEYKNIYDIGILLRREQRKK